jgi:hypothetical protein
LSPFLNNGSITEYFNRERKEPIIIDLLQLYFLINNILLTEQHGFRKHLSIETDIFTLFNNILQALNDGKLVGGIFCDLTIAFDGVNHDIILAKMDFYGIWVLFSKLITSYLSNRYQRVIIKDKQSKQYLSDRK